MKLENFKEQFEANFEATFTDALTNEVIGDIFKNRQTTDSIDCKNKFGIYVFFYKTENKFENLAYLKSIWDHEIGHENFSKVVQKNFDVCKFDKGFYPFYVGKSEELATRLNQHITHHKTHSTYGLKLANRKHFKLEDFEVGYWQLESDAKFSKVVSQFIITTLEQKVREKLNPLIGKK